MRGRYMQLIERYRPAIMAVALDRIADLDACRDITQDAMELAVRYIDDLRDPEALPGWLRAIAVNCCRQYVRRRRDAPAGLLAEEAPERESTHAAAVRREMLRHVRRALHALPENNRLALIMHVVHDMSYEDIARFLGVPATTVVGRIHRARKELRREHERWLADAAGDRKEPPG
jgi:RNA polymerase sigma-70 factor (ECF subfamily)